MFSKITKISLGALLVVSFGLFGVLVVLNQDSTSLVGIIVSHIPMILFTVILNGVCLIVFWALLAGVIDSIMCWYIWRCSVGALYILSLIAPYFLYFPMNVGMNTRVGISFICIALTGFIHILYYLKEQKERG